MTMKITTFSASNTLHTKLLLANQVQDASRNARSLAAVKTLKLIPFGRLIEDQTACRDHKVNYFCSDSAVFGREKKN